MYFSNPYQQILLWLQSSTIKRWRTQIWVLGTSSRYTTKKTLILLQIQPKPHFKIHKDVIRLLIVSRPPSDNFNDRDTSIRTSRKTENQKYGLFILFTGFRPQKDVNKRKNL